jgi:hypothetical protein
MRKKELITFNYCGCFIDLSGQMNEYKDQGLVPQFVTKEEREAFNKKIKRTIGSIIKLQKDAENFMNALSRPSRRKDNLPQHLHDTYDQMMRCNVKSQRWSDGLVYFACLGDQDVRCPVNSPFNLFGLAGSMIFLGLARGQPIRGAIDISWGVELHHRELYGAVIAKAYELESNVAKYPRIIVSDRTIRYLETYRQIQDNDVYSMCNRQLAEMCINMLTEDVDGFVMINYLGDAFKEYISKNMHNELYRKAFEFVQKEWERHRRERNVKLSFRYSHLHSYFMGHHHG